MKNALIIGSARSGNAVCDLCHAHGYVCTLIDEKKILNKQYFIENGIRLFEGVFPSELLKESFQLIIKNPGISHHHPFVKALRDQGHFIYSEIEIASWFAQNYRYSAITGTNGKTTTTAILEAILKREHRDNSAAGNIGIPLSELVYSNEKMHRKVALEIAAFQLLGIENFHPEVSVILNLAPDHLDVFDSIDDYYKAKGRITLNQKGEDWFLRNLDDENIKEYIHEVNCEEVTYSLLQEADLCVKDNKVVLFNHILFNVSDLKLKGKHNLQNAMVAAACAFKLDVSTELIQKGIQEFKGVEHRIEFVANVNGIEYYNDSKATTAESTKVALNAFEKNVIVLVGGYDKKTGFDILKDDLKACKKVIAFGTTKHQFKELLEATVCVNTLEEAFNYAHKIAEKGDVILLSPACASYDQFTNFEERGKAFKTLVEQV